MDVDDDSFVSLVIERSHNVPVVVDFWASWCQPCKTLGPLLDAQAELADGAWVLMKVDVDACPGLAKEYEIQNIPAVKAFRDGEVVTEFVGVKGPAELDAWVRSFVPSEADEHVTASREAESTEAERDHLEAALVSQDDHPEALVRLARLAVDAGDRDQARALLDRIKGNVRDRVAAARNEVEVRIVALKDAPPETSEGRYIAAHRKALEEDWEAAFEILLALVQDDRKYREDGRKAMLRLFDVVGTMSETTQRWRAELARALY